MNMLLNFPSLIITALLLLLCNHVLSQGSENDVVVNDALKNVTLPAAEEPVVVEPLPEEVLDLDGNPLKSGNTYTIMFGSKAGVGVAHKNDTCPLYAAQQPTPTPTPTGIAGPLKLRFHILSLDNDLLLELLFADDEDTIFEGEVLALEFNPVANLTCQEDSLVWQVLEDEVRTGGPTVVKGQTVSNNIKFQITKANPTDDITPAFFPYNRKTGTPIYKLRYCPSGDPSCQDVAKRVDPITTRPLLVVDNSDKNPFYVEFNKVIN